MPEGTGPFLVEGPLEVRLPDGGVEFCERPVVALCACRRSARYPFCDTSHRRRPPARRRQADGADGAEGAAAASDGTAASSGSGTRSELRPASQQETR